MNILRRKFLRDAASLPLTASPLAQTFFRPTLGASLAAIGALSSQNAKAADSSGYRALVCVFLTGGNDSHNWVVPYDAQGYAQYANVRRDIAVPFANLAPITDSRQERGRQFSMPTQLGPLREWYEKGKAAVVANVGPLVRPISKAEFKQGVGLPPKLFSHNDQASTWQSLGPEGAASGWGGRLADIVRTRNQYPVFTSVSATGNVVFLSGANVTQYHVGTDGPVVFRGVGASSLSYSNAGPAALRKVISLTGTSPFQAEYSRVVQRALDADAVLLGAYSAATAPAIPSISIPVGTGGAINLNSDSLAQQLKVVARMISAGRALGMQRQVFMVGMSGFDCHANEMRDQPALMARVSASIDYFLSAMQSMSLLDNVTLFTASEFGRTLTTNGSGCDHGWGSHQFVAGGAVKGQQIYGNFPITALGTEQDVGSGRLLPTTSVSEFAATMGSWMGLSSTDLQYMLPNLSSFRTSNVGFL